MPLVRAQDEVFESVEGIHFLMRDPDRREYVACVITHEALTHEPPLGPMQVFDNYRGEIEQAASDAGTAARWTATTSYASVRLNFRSSRYARQGPV
jgi:hypothetical protein